MSMHGVIQCSLIHKLVWCGNINTNKRLKGRVACSGVLSASFVEVSTGKKVKFRSGGEEKKVEYVSAN